MTRAEITIKVSPGTKIDDAFCEALRLATLLNVRIGFQFNGVQCSIGPEGSISKGVCEWNEAIKGETPQGRLKLAFG